MLTLGALTFVAPLALAGLLVLPALWWLLRVTPPAPLRVAFPPIRLLAALTSDEESAEATPPWLLVLRLVLAAAVVLGAAHPLINAPQRLAGSGPVAIVIDDGWAAARDWPARRDAVLAVIDRADREARPVILATTAAVAGARPPLRLLSAREARELAASLAPKPWPTDRAAAVEAVAAFAEDLGAVPGAVFWIADGLDDADAGAVPLFTGLAPLGSLTVIAPDAHETAMVLAPPASQGAALRAVVSRADAAGEVSVWVRAIGDDGNLVAREPVRFAAGERRTEAVFTLPVELRNRLARLELETEATAAAVTLTDERWRRRPVGLVAGGAATSGQPLLDDLHYLRRALDPFTEVREGSVEELLRRPLSVLCLVDTGIVGGTEATALARWIEAGGVLLRFAGPRLARTSPGGGDTLLPVELHGGDRVIGGALSWRRPARLAPLDAEDPFAGLAVPEDVTIRRQVLAEPSLDLAARTWVRLDDGTPLVTAERRGEGWSILVHTTANTEWSNLPLSGLFVDLLRRVVALSRGAVPQPGGPPLAPIETLDGFGRLGPPPPGAKAIAPADIADAVAGASHPPGHYGAGHRRQAVNLATAIETLRPLAPLPPGVARSSFGAAAAVDLRPWLLGLALLLAVADLAIALALRGLLRFPRFRRHGAIGVIAALAVAGLGMSSPVHAQELVSDGTALEAALSTRLAYRLTGDADIDAVSRAGLEGVRAVINDRTAAVLGPPVGVDPETDELAFYPLIYWPLIEGAPLPSEAAARRIDAYMHNGGTILFDTRARGGTRPTGLADLARTLDIPPLVPVPRDHVLGRVYYLLSEFPGRWTGGTVWLARGGERVNDGVTPVIAGSHDWAGAWAVDGRGRPMFAVVPGGEQQREIAYRFAINVVMLVLTGSYKADQVHLPAILERLGR